MYTIKDMYDLNETIASDLFINKTYPWEVLGDIEQFILKLGPTLPQDEFDHPEENIWIHKSVTVAKTATLNGPLIIDADTEVRPGAFIRGKAIVGKGVIEGQRVMLVQPQTYMNLSGESVRALMDYYKLTTDEIVIIYDDISMPVGQVRIRPKGSAGGHNGIKSIIAHLGTQEFPRIKIGVGAKPENGDLVKHVLGRFSKEDDAKIRDVFALAEEGLLAILQEDVKTAMNAVNGKKVGE